MTTEKPCSDHPDAPHGFVRNASHAVGHYVCECSGWTPPEHGSLQERLRNPQSIEVLTRAAEDGADRIDKLEAEVDALTKDAERLDHIQVTGSTVEIVKFWQKPVQHSFRVGGLYKAINFDLRLAIDAAMKESK